MGGKNVRIVEKDVSIKSVHGDEYLVFAQPTSPLLSLQPASLPSHSEMASSTAEADIEAQTSVIMTGVMEPLTANNAGTPSSQLSLNRDHQITNPNDQLSLLNPLPNTSRDITCIIT